MTPTNLAAVRGDGAQKPGRPLPPEVQLAPLSAVMLGKAEAQLDELGGAVATAKATLLQYALALRNVSGEHTRAVISAELRAEMDGKLGDALDLVDRVRGRLGL